MVSITHRPAGSITATQAVETLDKAGETRLADMGRAALDALADPAAAKALADKYGITNAAQLMDGLKLVASALAHAASPPPAAPGGAITVLKSYEDLQAFRGQLTALVEQGKFSQAALALKNADFSQGGFFYNGTNERASVEHSLAEAITAKGGKPEEFGLDGNAPMAM